MKKIKLNKKELKKLITSELKSYFKKNEWDNNFHLTQKYYWNSYFLTNYINRKNNQLDQQLFDFVGGDENGYYEGKKSEIINNIINEIYELKKENDENGEI